MTAKQVPFTAATRDPDKAMEKLGFETDTVYLDFTSYILLLILELWSESNYTKGICERDAGIFFLNPIGEVNPASESPLHLLQ